MNTTVEATNMQVRAVAEKGLLINEVDTAGSRYWDEQATAKQTATNPVLLYPTSTADGATWYHGASKKADQAAEATSTTARSGDLINDRYDTLSLSSIGDLAVPAAEGDVAAREVYGTTDSAAEDPKMGYYVKYTYYLKSAGAGITLSKNDGEMNVNIKSVSATATGNASTALNGALRVGIQMNTATVHDFYIYAPVAGYDAEYFVNAGQTTGETPTATGTRIVPIAGTTATITDLGALPSNGSAGTPVYVYVWYEGEDAALKSLNAQAALLDNIQIDIAFELKANPAA